MNEGKKAKAIELANQAKIRMEDPVIAAAFQSLRDDLKEASAKTGPHEHELREMQWCKIQVLDEVKQRLQSLIDAGKVAERS